jgi:hypothetical protein
VPTCPVDVVSQVRDCIDDCIEYLIAQSGGPATPNRWSVDPQRQQLVTLDAPQHAQSTPHCMRRSHRQRGETQKPPSPFRGVSSSIRSERRTRPLAVVRDTRDNPPHYQCIVALLHCCIVAGTGTGSGEARLTSACCRRTRYTDRDRDVSAERNLAVEEACTKPEFGELGRTAHPAPLQQDRCDFCSRAPSHA